MGLGHRWPEIARTYAEVNQLFGDIVKVTPSSKVVGDMTLFLFTRGIKPADVREPRTRLRHLPGERDRHAQRRTRPTDGRLAPESAARRPRQSRNRSRAGPAPICRPHESQKDPRRARREAQARRDGRRPLQPPHVSRGVRRLREILRATSATSPCCRRARFSTASKPGEEISVEIEEGKTLFIKLINVGAPDKDGRRIVTFELNGMPREATILDRSIQTEGQGAR